MEQRPLGKGTRKIYYVLATFIALTVLVSAYLNFHLVRTEREIVGTNERSAAGIAWVGLIEDVAGEVDAPGNDIFTTGDLAGETARLQAGFAKFQKIMQEVPADVVSDDRVLQELRRIDDAMSVMRRETAEIFRFYGLRQIDSAAASMAKMDRHYANVRKELSDLKLLLRARQLAEFRRQSQHDEMLAREQAVSVGLIALLVLGLVAYGRYLDRREALTSRERERYVAELDARSNELVHNQQLLSEAQRVARLGAWEWDLATGRVWWSDELYRLFAVEVGSVEPSLDTLMAFVAPADRDRVAATLAQTVSNRTTLEHEYEVVLPNGETRRHLSTAGTDVDAAGQPVRMLGVTQDITERKWAEDQLLRQGAQLSEAQRIARLGSWELEVEKERVTWSDELYEILGYEPKEIEPSFSAYMALVPPGEKPRIDALLEKATAEGEVFELEHRLVRKDGVEIIVLVQGVIRRDAGRKPIRVLGVSQDITARKKAEEDLRSSEERFQLASRATNDIIWDWNLVTNVVWVNEGFASRFGYPEWGDISVDLWYDGIHPDNLEKISASLRSAIDGAVSDWSGEYRFRHFGSNRWHEVLDRAYIVRDENGKAVRMLGAMMDISERRAVERMKDEFISTVSHELRTPLTSIRGALGLLSSGRLGTLPEKGQRLLHIASTNTDRLVRLINDILDIERIESGKVTLDRASSDGAELARNAVDVVRSLADRENLSIVLDARPSPLVADADRIVQTLTNLLGNAVKFSTAGSTILFSVRPEGQNVIFSVADQGRGIPPEKLGTIFERFQQVDASDSREKGGSGLGLAICRSIVRQHGGEIRVESELGHGSTFTITIPNGVAAASTQPVLTAQPKKNVFICDDDNDTRDVLKFFLTEHGFEVRETSSGQALLDAVAKQKPDAILLDLFMPGMNGWETLARLRNDPSNSNIPVIVASVLSPYETGAPGLTLSGWVPKPIDEKVLTGVVDRALRKVRRRPRLMLIEDDADLASIVMTAFERHAIETIHVRDGRMAVEMARLIEPDLLILDLMLPGLDGYGVIDWLKDNDVWRGLPLVVYSATEPSPSQRERLKLGYTEFMTKSRVAPEEFERRIIELLDTLTAEKGTVTHVA